MRVEPDMPRCIYPPSVFLEGRSDVTPISGPREINYIVDLGLLPLVLDHSRLIRRLNTLNLDPVIIVSVGHDQVGFHTVVNSWDKNFPSITCQPGCHELFIGQLLMSSERLRFDLGIANRHDIPLSSGLCRMTAEGGFL